MSLKETREMCGSWDEDLEWCDEEFPSECPFHQECKQEAESENGN